MASKKLKAGTDIIDSYVTRIFHYLWKDLGSLNTAKDIEQILMELGLSVEGWKEYSEGLGLKHLKEVHGQIEPNSINVTPVFFIGTEPFQGHSQLPLITARLRVGI